MGRRGDTEPAGRADEAVASCVTGEVALPSPLGRGSG